jgi:hypothetical protein
VKLPALRSLCSIGQRPAAAVSNSSGSLLPFNPVLLKDLASRRDVAGQPIGSPQSPDAKAPKEQALLGYRFQGLTAQIDSIGQVWFELGVRSRPRPAFGSLRARRQGAGLRRMKGWPIRPSGEKRLAYSSPAHSANRAVRSHWQCCSASCRNTTAVPIPHLWDS